MKPKNVALVAVAAIAAAGAAVLLLSSQGGGLTAGPLLGPETVRVGALLAITDSSEPQPGEGRVFRHSTPDGTETFQLSSRAPT